MKTIKIIDLLNKIANGEEVPEKFIWDDNEYYLQSNKCYKCDETLTIFEEDFILENLNDEVEIIGEEKKLPEKINVKGSYNSNKGYEDFNDNEKILVNKINEVLDYLESKEKGE